MRASPTSKFGQCFVTNNKRWQGTEDGSGSYTAGAEKTDNNSHKDEINSKVVKKLQLTDEARNNIDGGDAKRQEGWAAKRVCCGHGREGQIKPSGAVE